MFHKIHSDEIMYKVATEVTKINGQNKEVQYDCIYTGNLRSCRNYMAKKAIKVWKEGKKTPSNLSHFLGGNDSAIVRVDYSYTRYTITRFEIV